MSGRIKKCVCGRENAETEIICARCGSDISLLSPSSSTPKPVAGETAPGFDRSSASQSGTRNGTKRCPTCGRNVEGFLPLCECGADLSGIPGDASSATAMPECTAASAAASCEPRLFLVVGARSFEMHNGDILGREGSVASECFLGIQEVSRKHVLLVLRDGIWRLKPLTRSNQTVLDGVKLQPDVFRELAEGEHYLRMSTRSEVVLRITSA